MITTTYVIHDVVSSLILRRKNFIIPKDDVINHKIIQNMINQKIVTNEKGLKNKTHIE